MAKTMKKENKKLMEEMLTAIYARDKMDAIVQLVEKSDGEYIEKAQLLAIITQQDTEFDEDD